MVFLPSCRMSQQGEAEVRIADHRWRVELAITPEVRQRGLAEREAVPEGTGMLFVFPREEVVSFHMLNCRTPLDVAFLSSELTVVSLRTMPVEEDPANPRRVYSSRYPAQYALEVSAGALARAGVKVGDKAVLLGKAREAVKAAR
jgi:hypothetical protein